ncbi:MAG: formate dehydrogenase accessory sulfurtransferase FdhD [Vulcanimicrobiaceae bacterium]
MDPLGARAGASSEVRILSIEDGIARPRFDRVATEEPLEIRLRAGGRVTTLAITMRTPGNDFELAAGFLYGEGVIGSYDDLRGISYCIDPEVDPEQRYNIVNVDLHREELPELPSLERHFTTTSACGICGRASLEALRDRGVQPLEPTVRVGVPTIVGLPERLRAAQGVFDATGGLHAAALFDLEGRLLAVREDVGRHNALDKIVGWSVLSRLMPLDRQLVMVSGRSSYEIVQKCLAARVPVVCAVSAPSSLAVDLAREFGVTLIGFLRGARFNCYAMSERIVTEVASPR